MLGPLCEGLIKLKQQDTEEIRAIQTLLQRIPSVEPRILAKEISTGGLKIVRDQPNEFIIHFMLHSKGVRLMHAKDLDTTDKGTYDRATRAKAAKQRVEHVLDEEAMPIGAQQYLIAQLLVDKHDKFRRRFDSEKNNMPEDSQKSVLGELRSLAREMYWLELSRAERSEVRKKAGSVDQSLELHDELAAIRGCWYSQ